MTLRLVGIGGLGLMLSPSAKHLKASGPARFLRMHDRGTQDTRRDACRKSWQEHGAELVSDFEQLIGDGELDGVIICAGKNGDDRQIIHSLVPIIQKTGKTLPFIVHLSTVSAGFVSAAHEYLSTSDFDYANYPLTGGPAGAESGTMLILASGNRSLYEKMEPTLKAIGTPKFFGSSVTAGAEVKLIGQLMVFNGLIGICSAAALKAECFEEGLIGSDQSAFFDFLNGGAGGTRQWDVALSKGIRDNVWEQGFMIHHAVVDALYAAELCRVRGLPSFTVLSMISTALSFAYLLDKYKGVPLATHAIAREMLSDNSQDIDAFLKKNIDYANMETSIQNCIEVLPPKVRESVMLDIDANSFK